MASLDILCSNLLNLKNKFTKIEHKKIFCGPSKILKNISCPINICLKYFMTPTKTLRPLPPSSVLFWCYLIGLLLKHVYLNNCFFSSAVRWCLKVLSICYGRKSIQSISSAWSICIQSLKPAYNLILRGIINGVKWTHTHLLAQKHIHLYTQTRLGVRTCRFRGIARF